MTKAAHGLIGERWGSHTPRSMDCVWLFVDKSSARLLLIVWTVERHLTYGCARRFDRKTPMGGLSMIAAKSRGLGDVHVRPSVGQPTCALSCATG
jgi:hypothetical protein